MTVQTHVVHMRAARSRVGLYPDGVTPETSDDVIDIIDGAGGHVTREQLVRWHRAGLIPRPRVRHLGRGRGSVSIYPAGTAVQVLAVLNQQRHTRRLDDIAWKLWWDGYDIDEQVLRARLDRFVDRWAQLWDQMVSTEASGPSQAMLDQLAEARLPNRTLRWIRMRTGREEFPDLFTDLLRGLSGGAAAVNDKGQRRLGRVLSIGNSSGDDEMADTLDVIGKVLLPDTLRAVTFKASVEELVIARGKIQQLVGIVSAFGDISRAISGRWTPPYGALSAFLGDSLTQPDGQIVGVLGWLALEAAGLTFGAAAIFNLADQADQAKRRWAIIEEVREALPPDTRHLLSNRRLGKAYRDPVEQKRLERDIQGIRQRWGPDIERIIERHRATAASNAAGNEPKDLSGPHLTATPEPGRSSAGPEAGEGVGVSRRPNRVPESDREDLAGE
jgi:hypothetical protein